jgi:hypothetical protein
MCSPSSGGGTGWDTDYREFESQVGQIKGPRGAKTKLIESAIKTFSAEFTLADLERSYPVSEEI